MPWKESTGLRCTRSLEKYGSRELHLGEKNVSPGRKLVCRVLSSHPGKGPQFGPFWVYLFPWLPATDRKSNRESVPFVGFASKSKRNRRSPIWACVKIWLHQHHGCPFGPFEQPQDVSQESHAHLGTSVWVNAILVGFTWTRKGTPLRQFGRVPPIK